MGAAMGERWMDEQLTKLREKVTSFANAKMVANASTHEQIKQKKDAQLGVSSEKLVYKSRKQNDGGEEEERSRSSFNYKETCTLSESTICLLLDRFVPS